MPTTMRFVPGILGSHSCWTIWLAQPEDYHAAGDKDNRRKYREEYDFGFCVHCWKTEVRSPDMEYVY